MSSYAITIHFSQGDTTYGILRNGWSLPDLVGAKGRHATQSLSLSILSKEAAALFLSEPQRLLKAEVKKDANIIFEGVIRPYLGTSAEGVNESPIEIEVLDYTELLHHYISEDLVLQNLRLDQVVDKLFSLAGVTVPREYPSEFSSDSTLYIPLSQGEYVDDVLNELLFERGYDFKFSAGRCSFFATSTEVEPESEITDIRGTLSIQRSDDWSDGLRVRYMRAKEDDVVIYKHEREETDIRAVGGAEVGFPGGISFVNAKGLYYDGKQHSGNAGTPPSGKAIVQWKIRYNEPADQEIKLIGLQNVKIQASLGDEEGVALTPHVDEVGLTEGRVWVSYSGTFDYHEIPVASWFRDDCRWSWTWRIQVTAHVAYFVADSEEILTENGIRPDSSSKNLTYIHTESLAKAYVQREAKRQKTSSITYSFSSLTAYKAGGFYRLSESVTGVNTIVRILSCNQGADGLFSISAESASAMSVSEIALKQLYLSDMQSSLDTSFRIKADRTSFTLPSDSAVLEVSGVVASAKDIVFKWTLGDSFLGEGKSIQVEGSFLSPGSNIVSAKAYYQSVEMVSASVNLVLIQGQDGVGVSSITVFYAVSTSNEVAPGKWSTEAPYLTAVNRYLWSYEVISYTDGTSEETTKCVVGVYGDAGESFTVTIDSSNGNVFRPGDVETVLSCHVYVNMTEITEDIAEERFNWKRKTGDAVGDERWNTSSKAIGHRSVEITSQDCSGRTVFDCEVDIGI